MTIGKVDISADAVRLAYSSTKSGTARVFLWKGDARFIPVWTSSCAGDIYGFEACASTDGAAPPWSPDMSGRLLDTVEATVVAGSGTVELAIDAETYAALTKDSQILVSFAEAGLADAGDGVNAWAFPIQVAADSVKPGKPGKPGKR
jgi:hypothetical protein